MENLEFIYLFTEQNLHDFQSRSFEESNQQD